MNLLSNAVKFTDRGTVAITVSVESATLQEAHVRFAVSDTGIGIAPADHERVFAPFTQVDASSTRRHGGTGLGLAIVAELVRAMGGSVSIESELGRGSTFVVTMALAYAVRRATADSIREKPAERPHPAETSAASPEGPDTRLRVLVVEDTRANQELVKRALGRRGHVVEVAEDGRQAVDFVSRAAFDVVLMDLQMPVMDGFQATAAIRAMPDAGQVPIIALTAHATADDRDRCRAAGMDDFLPKPLDITKLVEMVEDAYRPSLRAKAENEPHSCR